MRLWNRLRSWAETTLRRSRMESEMDAELRFHIEAFADDLVRGGVLRPEALRRARLEFGSVERVKEEGREARGVSLSSLLYKVSSNDFVTLAAASALLSAVAVIAS
jgi:hypothetical protein